MTMNVIGVSTYQFINFIIYLYNKICNIYYMRIKFAVMQNRMYILMVKKRMDKIIDPLIGGVGVQAQGNYQENTKKALSLKKNDFPLGRLFHSFNFPMSPRKKE